MLRALPEQLFNFFLVGFLDQTWWQRDAVEYEVPLGEALYQLGPEQLRSICLNRGETRNVGHTGRTHGGGAVYCAMMGTSFLLMQVRV